MSVELKRIFAGQGELVLKPFDALECMLLKAYGNQRKYQQKQHKE